jgi:hypothetical protein
MPNRMLRDWTRSEKVAALSVHAERFFVRLIMKVDDYGCYYAAPDLLKADLFPKLLNSIREADISCWIADCEKAGLIVSYEAENKKYLQILDFRQRLDRARAKFPLPENQSVNVNPPLVNDIPPEVEVETEEEKNTIPANAGASASDKNHISLYSKISRDKKSIIEFIQANNPKIIDPYADLWNLFAGERGLPKVEKINSTRKRKFSVRIREKGFDFISILTKAGRSEFLLSGNWFGFDWLIANDNNFQKVLEGKYDTKPSQTSPSSPSKMEVVL